MRRRRPAYVTPDPEPRYRSIDDDRLVAATKIAVTLLTSPVLTPNVVEFNRYVLAEMSYESLLDFEPVQTTDGVTLAIWFYLRGQEVCDRLWGAGRLPNANLERRQITGAGAGDYQYAQVAFSPILPMLWSEWTTKN